MIVAFDTSTDTSCIALYDTVKGVIAEQTWLAGRQQTTQLLPNLQRLMALTATTVRGITGVAVATGPGSFSGVRIGISTAKSMAYALAVPLWGVATLDGLAYAHAAVTAAQVCTVLAMGRGRLAWAVYRTRGAKWQRLTPYAIGSGEDMARQVQTSESNVATLFCGEIGPDTAAGIREILGDTASIAPPAASPRRASYLAELAAQRHARGEADDPATLQAIYLQAVASSQ